MLCNHCQAFTSYFNTYEFWPKMLWLDTTSATIVHIVSWIKVGFFMHHCKTCQSFFCISKGAFQFWRHHLTRWVSMYSRTDSLPPFQQSWVNGLYITIKLFLNKQFDDCNFPLLLITCTDHVLGCTRVIWIVDCYRSN